MKPKKSLGQNFLKSESALQKIVEAGDIKEDDIILEIGPGKGALTEKLLEKAGLVIAIEKDTGLVSLLKEKFSQEIKLGSLVLVHDDILEFNISETVSKFFSGPRFSGSLSQPDHSKNLKPFRYKIIANIPYNITGAILKKFLTAENQPENMVLMVQHEVAQRIIAQDGKESLLSISVKAYGQPKMIAKVDKRYFSPAPKVNSAIVSIKNISRALFVQSSTLHSLQFEEKFWKIVKAGFAHKRKKLSGNLKDMCQKMSLTGHGDKRAEDLTLSDWISLSKKCYT